MKIGPMPPPGLDVPAKKVRLPTSVNVPSRKAAVKLVCLTVFSTERYL